VGKPARIIRSRLNWAICLPYSK